MDHNPYLRRRFKAKGKHGQASEKRLAKLTGGKQTRASGALDFEKGDLKFTVLLAEAKATVRKSLSLKYEWLVKITKEALPLNRRPVVFISFVEESGKDKLYGDWVLIPRTLYEELDLDQEH